MTRIAHAISEVTNVTPDTHQPYVGLSAFAHKAGLHASAIRVDPMLYQHIDPALVGNDMRMLVSDMAGRASVELKGRELGFDLSGDKEVIGRVTDRVKELEAHGYSFEAADASFELLLRDELAGERRRHFTVESWRVIVEQREDGQCRHGDQRGDGPAGRQGRARRRRRRGQRPGQRARPRAAVRPGADLPRARHPGADRLQGPHPRGLGGHRRDHPGADRVERRRAAAPGPRSAWTRTSSPPPGTPWRRRSPTACSARAASPNRPRALARHPRGALPGRPLTSSPLRPPRTGWLTRHPRPPAASSPKRPTRQVTARGRASRRPGER